MSDDLTNEQLRKLAMHLSEWPSTPWKPQVVTGEWIGSWEAANDVIPDAPYEIDGTTDSDYPDQFANFVAQLVNAAPKLLAEVERRRSADESAAIDKAVADAAIALDHARDERAAAQRRYFKETEHGTAEHDLAWIAVKATGDKLTALEIAHQRTINVAVAYRDDPSLGRVAAVLAKIGDDVVHIVASPPVSDE